MELYLNSFTLMVLALLRLGLNALPSEECIIQQQVYLLKNLMVKLHNIHNFDNIIIYRTPDKFFEPPVDNGFLLKTLYRSNHLINETVHKCFGNILVEHVSSAQLYKPYMTFSISPWEYTNNTKDIPNLGTILSNENLALVILNDIYNIELKEFVARSLGASLKTKIVFLLIGHEMTNVNTFVRLEKIQRFFRWCWSKNILNVILLFQKNHIKKTVEELELEVYSYTPFPKPYKILHLTGQQPREYFQDRTSNLLGYRFKTPVISEKPLVFKTLQPFADAQIVSGISGHIYMEYIKYINATFQELKYNNSNSSWVFVLDHIHNLLKARKIDISINAVTALRPNNFTTSYPISTTNSCVVVPVKQEIFSGLYIPRTLSLEMWFLLISSFLIFNFSYMIINHDNYGQTRPWLAFSTTLKGLLTMPVNNMGRYKTITKNSISYRRKIFMHMLLLLTGMIYCQTFIAALSSFLSSPLYPKQIETLEDLRKANISIMLPVNTYDIYNYLDLIPDNFSRNVIITDFDIVSYHLNKLDTRYAYTVYREEWKVIERLQINLWKPRFKIVPQLCIPNVYLTLPMQFNSPFYHSFMRFILLSQTAGLKAKWSRTIFWQIQKANGINGSLMDYLEHITPLKLEHLTYILYIYAGGMVMATIVFLIEVQMGHFNKKKEIRRENCN